MKTFQFKFEALLTHRKLRVRELETKLAKINTKARWFADRLTSIKEEITRMQGQLVDLRLEGNLKKNQEVMDYLSTLQNTFLAIEKAHASECVELSIAKKEIEKAVTLRKIIENLRETHYTHYLKQQERKEEYYLDELRSTKHPR